MWDSRQCGFVPCTGQGCPCPTGFPATAMRVWNVACKAMWEPEASAARRSVLFGPSRQLHRLLCSCMVQDPILAIPGYSAADRVANTPKGCACHREAASRAAKQSELRDTRHTDSARLAVFELPWTERNDRCRGEDVNLDDEPNLGVGLGSRSQEDLSMRILVAAAICFTLVTGGIATGRMGVASVAAQEDATPNRGRCARTRTTHVVS